MLYLNIIYVYVVDMIVKHTAVIELKKNKVIIILVA